jgi:proteasome accessory factor B
LRSGRLRSDDELTIADVLSEEVSMAQRRTERLLNLVICLLSTRRFLTKDEIREAVQGYGESQDGFERAFERDKDELRELGIPLETGSNSAYFEDEVGYRIAHANYDLPAIDLTPAEIAVLGVAARFWQRASLGGASGRAFAKLAASAGTKRGRDRTPGDDDTPGTDLVGIEPRLVRDDPAFVDLWSAATARRAVEFDYRPLDAPLARRHLEPWGLVSYRGRWYVVGHDRDRDERRVFRLARIVGPVTPVGAERAFEPPAELNLRGVVANFESAVPQRTARVRIRSGHGIGLRRAAVEIEPAGDGWDVVELTFGDAYRLADELLGYGPDVVVEEPADVRTLVGERLAAVAR